MASAQLAVLRKAFPDSPMVTYFEAVAGYQRGEGEEARKLVESVLAERPDQSVALHAFRLSLSPSLKLGSLDTFDFEAPIPATWKTYFGMDKTPTC